MRLILSCILCLIAAPAARAFACGVSGPDNVWSCSLEEHEEAERPRWFVGVVAVHTATTLRFSDTLRADQSRNALVATAGYALSPRLMLQASAGAAFAGELKAEDDIYEFNPGPTFAAGLTYRLIDDPVFVTLSGVLSGSFATTQLRGGDESASYGAFDLRLGVAAGIALFDVLRPYVVARVFGGPVFWSYRGDAVTGTDVSHVQLGAGLALLIAERIDLFIEGIPLGEQALSGGLTVVL